MDNYSKNPFDLVILGGGLAGLTLAIQCKQRIPDLNILVLEKHKHPVPEAAFKVGESSVEVAAHYFGEVLGLKDHILEQQLPKLGLRFFFPHGQNTAIEERLEIGGRRYPPAPSYQLDRGRFENFLAEHCKELGISFVDAARVRDVTLSKVRRKHRVTFSRNGLDHDVKARWLVDASGRAAILKRKLGLAKPSRHLANAAWFRIDAKISVDDWCSDPEWLDGHEGKLSRWYSTNHLMGEGYWVWLIPLASGSTSVGIVADDRIHPRSSYNSLEKAMDWLDRFEPQCAAKVREHIESVQDFRAIKHYMLDCKKVFSQNRWGITGEAGYFLDPFYSPGSDFIAFGNTFLTELIDRDMQGKSNQVHTRTYNIAYRRFFEGTLHAYEGQYPLFGDHQVMPVKVLWDYMTYWTLTGFLFFHQRTCNPLTYFQNVFRLKRINDLNQEMQKFFRYWHEQNRYREISGLINLSEIPLIFDTNKALLDTLSDAEFRERFSDNAEMMEQLLWEIVDAAGLEYRMPFRRKTEKRSAAERYFEQVFRVTSGTVSPRSDQEPMRVAVGGIS